MLTHPDGITTEGESAAVYDAAVGSPTEPSLATFEELYRSEVPRLLAYAMRLGATRVEAEDAVHDTMVELLRHWRSVASPRAWARVVIGRRLMRDRQRARREGEGPVELYDFPSPGVPHDDAVMAADQIRRLLELLPVRQREVIAFQIDGYSIEQTATALGASPATVRSNLRHARQRLMKALNQERQAAGAENTPPMR